MTHDYFYSVNEINAMAQSDPAGIARLSEERFSAKISELCAAIGGRRIICLSGPSSSGKTTSANMLAAALTSLGMPSAVISLDDFYKPRAALPMVNGKQNAEVIEALEVDMIDAKVNELILTGSATMPRFDFVSGIRVDDDNPVTVPPNGKIIIEGIHALNDKICSGLPAAETYKVYASPHSGFVKDDYVCLTKRELRCLRRMVRDSHSRNTTAETTLKRWPSVCEGEDLYVRPLIGTADFRLDTTHEYEPCLLKKAATELLNSVAPYYSGYEYAQHLLCAISEFAGIDVSLMPRTSLLVEFLG